MSGEKQCPLKIGQRVTVCSGERCAWWDDDRMTRGCVLMTIAVTLGEIARGDCARSCGESEGGAEMSTETDATRLAEIGTRCELATEGPWETRKKLQGEMCSSIAGPDDRDIVGHWVEKDSGVVWDGDARFIAHAREDVPWLLGQLGKADAAWQATESRIVHICQLLNVDYTCEEPKTCEQVIERLLGRLAVMRKALEAIRGQSCVMGTEWGDSATHKIAVSALAADASKPEADVIAAAARYEDADRQHEELDPNNPWYRHYQEIVIDARIKAAKDLCDAVKRLREGSGGAAEASVIKEDVSPDAKQEDIKRLMTISGAGEMGVQIMTQMLDTFKKGMPGVPEKFWEDFMAEVEPGDLVDLVVPIYDRHLTHDVIRCLIAFYESRAGRKFTGVQPAILKESYAVGAEWARKLGEHVQVVLENGGVK